MRQKYGNTCNIPNKFIEINLKTEKKQESSVKKSKINPL